MHFEDQWVRTRHRRQYRAVAARAAFWAALIAVTVAAAVLVAATQQGCGPGWITEIEEGVGVRIDWPSLGSQLIPTNTATVRLTIWHEQAVAGSLTLSIRAVDFDLFTLDVPRPVGAVSQRVAVAVPAGADRAVRAEALDSAGEVLGADEAYGIRVLPGEVTQVRLALLVNGDLDIVVE